MGIFNDIKKQISRDVSSAMQEARNKSSEILDDNIVGYYSGEEPEIYDRTGTLIDASNVTPVSCGVDSFEFTVEMDGDRISYSTGRPLTGSEVVQATEEGGYGTVGSHGYFKKTESQIPNTVDSALSKKFGKG